MVKKLEKELDITLVENVSSAPSALTGTRSDSGLTLGDFIKRED
jgi:ribosome-binding protein aMBF1 (putative translation factor)